VYNKYIKSNLVYDRLNNELNKLTSINKNNGVLLFICIIGNNTDLQSLIILLLFKPQHICIALLGIEII
jgi:hypothetical protein